ncbi:1-phosphofructokinase family hexose kinase [uncultured Maritimibacter sp.]|jgi:6-phosphofructokinase 2|uniref:1-phosphofructokinase family hexose kinase n=1 Tax=uncultured Maritimibacter sp. TaxID=991866 RepID=UPI000A4607DC|nr:1-phosphofructokinase family hexose kinase [uncultured Maritimibacter sp.]
MTDILTVTLNPALDLSTSAPVVRPEDKLRCETLRAEPGGGGVNVARAIGLLGGASRAFVVRAGHVGQQFTEVLSGQPLDPVWFDIPGETRQSLSVTDRSTGAQFRFVMPGPDWDAALASRVCDSIAAATAPGGIVVLSGSQPPGVPDDFPGRLAQACAARSARLILDTSGPALRALPDDGALHTLRLDGAESVELAGRPLPDRAAVAGLAQDLVARKIARTVVLAMGADGSVLATKDGVWHCNTEDVPVVSKIGAGDSFVGSYTLALARGAAPQDALVRGCAAASAAVMTEGTELCRAADVDRLAASAVLTPL